jgi:DNA adenine methylase
MSKEYQDLFSLDSTINSEVKASPFLKWVGGKRSIIEDLKKRLPASFGNYYEPFVGGGALFFEMHSKLKKAFLSDANLDLITTYNVIKNEPAKLIQLLKKHQNLHCEEYYYRQRSKHDLNEPIEIAARMIYLNKTCFNGLWRVNKKGEFNVPIGRYTNPGICQEDNINACSKALEKAQIYHQDYSKISAQKGDFVYFDPPYHPINETSFTTYAANDFTEKDQQALANFCLELTRAGVKLMVSNSNTDFIRKLFSSPVFKIEIVNAPRLVNCKSNGRKAVEEVLITNY